MKIAITSPNGKSISGHAGKCPGYLVYDIQQGRLHSKQHIKLTKDQVFRHFSGALSSHPDHPLHGINWFITQGIGDGLHQRLTHDGIQVLVTEMADSDEAVQQVVIAFSTP